MPSVRSKVMIRKGEGEEMCPNVTPQVPQTYAGKRQRAKDDGFLSDDVKINKHK